ncbi:MAG: hypothetical protein IJ594_05935 [Oscillospiraceae bacterium]|nr:hypothetical protein [Oscillospiraceae bacterium]
MLTVKKGGHRDLERYYPMMEIDFDRRELLPKLSIHRAISRGEQELLLFVEEESQLTVAYALVCVKSLYGYVLLKYMGVLPWYRGHNLGVETMRLINRRYAERQGILAELTVFDEEDDTTLKKLRRFFARFGYVQVDCAYRLGGVPAELLVKPIKGSVEIEPVAHRMIEDFYSRCLTPAAQARMVDIRPAAK